MSTSQASCVCGLVVDGMELELWRGDLTWVVDLRETGFITY